MSSTKRTFTNEFKRQVVEEALSGVSSVSQLARRHHISAGLIHHWKKRYAFGKLENEPTIGPVTEEHVAQLEQMLGRVTLENEFLKKALRRQMDPTQKSGRSLRLVEGSSKAPRGGASS